MIPLAFAIAAILSYLLGSIPTGYLMAKAKGVDIRTVGSGNIGATNVFRALGKTAGIITLMVDCAKGIVAVVVVPMLVVQLFPTLESPPDFAFATIHRGEHSITFFDAQTTDVLPVTCALFVILGHNYTCWLKFKGGKGIATSAGAVVALAPMAMLICLGVWLVVFAIGRYVSLASIAAAFALPIAVYFTKREPNLPPPLLFYLAILLGLFAIWRHRSNIQRLRNGTENRLTRKPKTETHPS